MEVLLVLLALCLIVHLLSKIDLGEESTPKQKKDDYHYRNVDDQLWEYNNKKQRKNSTTIQVTLTARFGYIITRNAIKTVKVSFFIG